MPEHCTVLKIESVVKRSRVIQINVVDAMNVSKV